MRFRVQQRACTHEKMQRFRSIRRRVLDQRLAGLDDQIGPRPPFGWIREIREALGMSTWELAPRMGVTASRVSKIERAEATGSLLLSTLEAAAAALDCRLCYVLVPNDPLQKMVRQQALRKATQIVAESRLSEEASVDAVLLEEVLSAEISALAHELVDRRGLWRVERPGARGTTADQSVQTSTTRHGSGTMPGPSAGSSLGSGRSGSTTGRDGKVEP